MMRSRLCAWLMITGGLTWSQAVSAATSPDRILQYQPKQQGVIISTPTAQELPACKVSWAAAKPGRGGTWILTDPQGKTLRRFIDNKGDGRPHVWCYYHEGAEVYREIDSDFDGEADQYRWLNGGGMKWGVALGGDHKISTWKMISQEEVSQEILQAVVQQDFGRVRGLFISEAEMKALGMPAAEVNRIRETQKLASAKFQQTMGRLSGLSAKTRWVHLETGSPMCIPADATGMKQDLIKYARGTILCETEGKHDWLQTGEMIKVGLTWRLVDAPGAGLGDAAPEATAAVDPALQGLLDQLRDLDANSPKVAEPAQIVAYNLARATLLQQIAPKVKADERDQWIRQVADCLSAAAQHSPATEKSPYQQLKRLEEETAASLPGSALAAYVTFREMQADNAARLAQPGHDIRKVQEQWLERLAKFVGTYPQAEDAPEALMQLGMVSEFVDKELEAKKWYGQLVKDHSAHPIAPKAQGALRRLELEGKELELTGTLLDGGEFSMAQVKGKMVVVYYWAAGSNRDRCVGDFAILKQLLENYSTKGLTLVTINLDTSAEEASAFLQKSPAPGMHLHQPGGFDSPPATHYGIMALPNFFLVDRDGKVISRSIQQATSLEEEIKKRLK